MHDFFDPRIEKPTSTDERPTRITAAAEQLVELHALCRAGRLYDVERWIQGGRPLQVARTSPNRNATSALQIAIDAGNHALVLLLLVNGYDANQEINSPLDLALRNRRFDLVTLLLDWGTDPNRVDLDDLFGTYNSGLFERFRALGVDLTADHALAGAIAYHTSNKPLLGFAKRHRLDDGRFQKELDIALAHHAAEGNDKGLQLCLWAGANPHAAVPSLRFGGPASSNEDPLGEDDGSLLSTAIYEACQSGREEILKRLRPDPALDDFEELWRVAASDAVIDVLARHGLPVKVGSIVQHHVWWATFGDPWRRVAALKRLFEVGARWKEASHEEVGALRRSLLKAADSTFIDLIKVLTTDDYCSPKILSELARTPSMLNKMRKVGFISSRDEHTRSNQVRPSRSREVIQKLGIRLAAPKPRTPTSQPDSQSVRIGGMNGQGIELDRTQLFERVWSKPVAILAKEFGISGPGLKKICRRLSVPVPPRGYWAKLQAGKRVRRPSLP